MNSNESGYFAPPRDLLKEVESLQQQLASVTAERDGKYHDDPEMVCTNDLGWVHVNAKEYVEELKRQLAEAITAAKNYSKLAADYEQERDKLMALVREKDSLIRSAIELYASAGMVGCTAEAKLNKAIELTLDNLPRFVPEEKVKPLMAALDRIGNEEKVSCVQSNPNYAPRFIARKALKDFSSAQPEKREGV